MLLLLLLLLSFYLGWYITTVVYYVKIKKYKIIGTTTVCYNSLMSLYLLILYKINNKHNYEAIINPFTFRLHIRDKEIYDNIQIDSVLYRHEFQHIKQVEKFGIIKFIFLYLKFYKKYGYEKNPFEIEAREAEIISNYNSKIEV